MNRASPHSPFAPGTHIAHRSVDRVAGIVMTVLAQLVVRDDPGAIVTFMPSGSLTKRRTGVRNGGPHGRQLTQWDGGHEDRLWSGTNVVMVHRPGDAFSLWCAWDQEWRPAWWYVNLEEPWRRTAIGFDSRDLWLDLTRKPDEPAWRWKDEDELAWAVEQGLFSAERASEIRRAGEGALETIARRAPPFDADWASWRPQPTWDIPTLPPDRRTEPVT
jgi:uncharacterized protein DUF402